MYVRNPGKEKRKIRGPCTGKNPRISLFGAVRHSRSFARGDTHHDPPFNAKEKITKINGSSYPKVNNSSILGWRAVNGNRLT